MARPQKNTVDYFSHDANASDGKTLSVLFNHFGHEGLSAWWLLLERISNTRNHVISIGNPDTFEYLAAKLHFQPERLQQILTKMAELDAIDQPLFKAGYIWCQNFVDRQEPIYKYRHLPLPTKPELPGKETELLSKETELSLPVTTPSKIVKNKIVKNKSTQEISLPEWIDKTSWDAYLEMRKAKPRTPTTPHAIELILKKLADLKEGGHDVNKVLDQSTLNGWTDVYPMKEGNNNGQRSAQHQGITSIPGNRPAGAFANLENV